MHTATLDFRQSPCICFHENITWYFNHDTHEWFLAPLHSYRIMNMNVYIVALMLFLPIFILCQHTGWLPLTQSVRHGSKAVTRHRKPVHFLKQKLLAVTEYIPPTPAAPPAALAPRVRKIEEVDHCSSYWTLCILEGNYHSFKIRRILVLITITYIIYNNIIYLKD